MGKGFFEGSQINPCLLLPMRLQMPPVEAACANLSVVQEHLLIDVYAIYPQFDSEGQPPIGMRVRVKVRVRL